MDAGRVDLLVVGGGPAALAAARGYRDGGGRGSVRLLSDDDRLPYRRPPLSKDYLRGEAGPDALPLEGDSWYADHGVEVSLRTSVTALDVHAHTVTTDDGVDRPYRRLVLATGASPKPLPVPGGEHPEVLLLRRPGDSDRIRDAVGTPGRRAVVVGSGFIGCEVACSLARLGAEVTLVSMEDAPQRQRLGDHAADQISRWLCEHGVELHLGASVERVEDARTVVLDGGTRVTGDAVVVGAGIAPRGELAERAGLATEDGRVLVDARLATGVPNVFAAGDCARAVNAGARRRLEVEHWGEALAMGEVAGRAAAGDDTAVWDTAPGFWSAIGDHTLKYVAWGDGFDTTRVVTGDHPDAFTVWYGRDGVVVGVLTSEHDDDADRGRALVEAAAPWTSVTGRTEDDPAAQLRSR